MRSIIIVKPKRGKKLTQNRREFLKTSLLGAGLSFSFSDSFAVGGMKTGQVSQTTRKRVGHRQIHLDFHTSEYLPNVGEAFSKKQFQSALKIANVDAVNIFGKGHHSWSYYPTKVGQMHPNLKFDLLGQQIEACHEIGVAAPIYFTFGWSHNDAINHPEWCSRFEDGSRLTNGHFDSNAGPDDPKPDFHWIFMCVNTSYHDHVMRQLEELCVNYDIDGIWMDIYQVSRPCYCGICKKMMLAEGFDISKRDEAIRFLAKSFKRHQKSVTHLVHKYHPQATVYFNGCTAINRGAYNFEHKMYEYNTIQDLEDLPTTWGGYDKLPMQSKYFLNAGYPITAMSGKFHTAWGEFGGFKSRNALRYEAAAMISWGANCNFGDQLHPSGKMDLATYKNIGAAYKYVELIENYGVGGIPEARVGVWRTFSAKHDEGTCRMLLESHTNFDIANVGNKDLNQFDVIVIPGKACLEAEDSERLKNFTDSGGGILVMGAGALDKAHQNSMIDIGARYLGKSEFDKDYLVVKESLWNGLVTSPFLCYKPALRVAPDSKTKVLATIREPFFSRTYEKFTSHQNTPFKLVDADYPGVIQNGNVIFVAHELDAIYYDYGARLHRDLFGNALGMLNFRPMVETSLPSAARVSFLHQPDQGRYVVHLLYGPPIQRGKCEVIEDLPTLFEVPVILDLSTDIKRATLVPEMRVLPIEKVGSKIKVTVPKFSCHCAISLNYA